MRSLLVRGGLIVTVIATFVAALFIGHSNWQAPAAGLPDAGQLMSWVLKFALLANTVLGIRVLGQLMVTAFIAPGNGDHVDSTGRRVITQVGATSSVWAISAVTAAVATLSDVLGLPAGQTFAPGLIPTYIWALPPSRSYLITAALAVAIAFLSMFVTSLNQVVIMLALTAAAIVSPLLNSHSATLGDHSLALTSSVLHGLSMSAWVGGLWAVLPFVRDSNFRVIKRYSVLATTSIIMLMLSGVAAGYARMNSISELLGSPYGRLVLAKVVLFTVILFTANRIRKSLGSNTSVARLVGFELFVMAISVSAGVALHSTAPSRTGKPFASAAEDLLGFAFPPAPTAWHLISGWHPEWLMLTGSCIALAAYIAGVRRLRTLQVSWSFGRTLSFIVGIVLLMWSTSGGVSKYAMLTFSSHMIQHMTLSMIAPIFLVLGMPTTLALRALPSASDSEHRNARAWILAGIHSPYSRIVSHPLIVLAIFTFGLYGLYFTSFFSTLMGSHSGHVLMEIHFLLVGLLFSWVIIGLDPMPREFPHWARLILVLVAISLHAFFAIAIMQSAIPIGDAWYSQVTPPWITDPLADSNLAGGIAWGLGEVPTLLLMVLVAVQWSRKDARLAKQLDRAADRDDDAQLKAYNEQLAHMNSKTNIN